MPLLCILFFSYLLSSKCDFFLYFDTVFVVDVTFLAFTNSLLSQLVISYLNKICSELF